MPKTPETIAWICRLFNDSTKTIVFHNAKFDLKMFSFEGIDIFSIRAKVDCTLILSKLFNMMLPSYELRWLSIHFLRRSTEHKDEIKDWLKAHRRQFLQEKGRLPNFSDAPRAVVARRAIWDVTSTLLLWARMKPRVFKTCRSLYKTERDLMFVVIDMENRGVEVDLTRARALRRQARKYKKRILRDIKRLVGDISVTCKRKGQTLIKEVAAKAFLPTSNQHLEGAFRKLGIPLKYKTKPKKKKDGTYSGGGNWSFDEYSMIRYVSKPLARIIRDSGEEGWKTERFYDEIYDVLSREGLSKKELLPPLVLKFRELSKMISTYYDHIITQAVDVRERGGRTVGTLHCSFNQSEAKTGRFSSSSPNMQNMPRLLGPRECFICRIGRRNWHFDYEQVEMKFFCHFSEDDDMTSAIADDIHLFVASQIYELPKEKISSEQRKRAKAINFGILYGAGPEKIAETLTERGLPTTVAEASLLCARYHRRFPSIRRLTQEFSRQLLRDGYVTNPFGRRYHVSKKQGYKILNYMCQGTSADLMKNRMVRVWKYLREIGSSARMLITVHDELVVEMAPRDEQFLVPKIRELMCDRTSYYIPITVGVDVVPIRWSKKFDPMDLGLT
jgi:DNA polymerase I-like protein with 3'-5' exonuclease and polymerase domains